MLDQRQIEVIIKSISDNTVFLVDYQIDDNCPPDDEYSEFDVVGLWSFDAETGEEVDLTGLLKLQLPINDEIEQACIEHANKEYWD